jgi:hypothetical protein
MGIVIDAVYYKKKDDGSYEEVYVNMNAVVPENSYLESLKTTAYVSKIPSTEYNDSKFYIGYSNIPTANSSITNSRFFQGYFRNFTLFKGHLTKNEIRNFAADGILTKYQFPDLTEQSSLKNLLTNDYFYIGLIGVYSVRDFKAVNCDFSYNGKKFKVIS